MAVAAFRASPAARCAAACLLMTPSCKRSSRWRLRSRNRAMTSWSFIDDLPHALACLVNGFVGGGRLPQEGVDGVDLRHRLVRNRVVAPFVLADTQQQLDVGVAREQLAQPASIC